MISIVITTHGDSRFLPTILRSLNDQREYREGICPQHGNKYWYEAREDFKGKVEVIISSNGAYEGPNPVDYYPGASILKIVESSYEGRPGHNTRNPGIQAATGNFIISTNQDNYFPSWALSRITQESKNPLIGLLYSDCVNNLWKCTNNNGSKLIRTQIDLCCAIVKNSVAKKVGFPWRNFDGDFDYIDACAKEARRQGLTVKYVNEVWGIHN